MTDAAIAEVLSPEATRLTGKPGRTIRLSDGREWFFASPSAILTPRLEYSVVDGSTTSRIVVDIVSGLPPEVASGLKVCAEHAQSNDSGMVPYEPLFALASAMLRHCHALDETQAFAVLAMPEDHFQAFVLHMMAVATGRDRPTQNIDA